MQEKLKHLITIIEKTDNEEAKALSKEILKDLETKVLKTDKSYVLSLATKYADLCEFKSDFKHHRISTIDGFVTAYFAAKRFLCDFKL